MKNMELYHGTLSDTKQAGVMSHLGTMKAAIARLEGVFILEKEQFINPDGTITIFDKNARHYETIGSHVLLDRFGSFMDTVVVSKYDLNLEKPLWLKDCWLDNPIGCAALEMFKDNTQLSMEHHNELKDLFYPFETDTSHDFMRSKLSSRDFSKYAECNWNHPVFNEEMSKRFQLAKARNLRWEDVMVQETVWVGLTAKLYNWAVQKGYDSFAYKNEYEDTGTDSYVPLKNEKLVKRSEKFVFNKELYKEAIYPIFDAFLKAEAEKPRWDFEQSIQDCWAGQDPTQFWTPKGP